ncbi:hypothetical protein B0T24DRAFT_485853, partial [Lasiosphaeria ovina]
IECIRARHTGALLLPYTNVPELWSLDPTSGRATLLANFTSAESLPRGVAPFAGFTGLAEVAPDLFAVLSGNFSTTAFTLGNGSWGVWTFDFGGRDKPVAKFVRQVAASQFFLGAARYDARSILIADGGQGLLYRLDVLTGRYSVVSADASMGRSGGLAGIHGVRYAAPYVYYTNTFGGGFWRMRLDPATGLPAPAAGPPVLLAPLQPGDRPEEFATWRDGSVYVAIQAGGVERVAAGSNVSTPFVNVERPTTVVFGRMPGDADVLYIATGSG